MNAVKKYYHFKRNTTLNNKISELVDISLKGLEEMYLAEYYMFAERKIKVNNKVTIERKNLRYTFINLIGLQKAKDHGYNVKIDLEKIINFHIKNVDAIKSIGDLGLFLWAVSLVSPIKVLKIFPKINLENLFIESKDSKSGNTMELSWFLIGLIFASTFNEKFKGALEGLPNKVYQKLRSNYSGHGIFKHENTFRLEGKFRSHIGTLADQLFAIYALSLYSKIMGNEEAILIAEECTKKICSSQDKNGRWKWHFDSESGKAINNYPIYPVHQFALAPMVLFSMQMTSNNDFLNNIYKSIEFLSSNEKFYNRMVNVNENTIWNKIAPINNNKISSILNLTGLKFPDSYEQLKIHYECSSYVFGWILFTFSGRIQRENIKNPDKIAVENELQIFDMSTHSNNH